MGSGRRHSNSASDSQPPPPFSPRASVHSSCTPPTSATGYGSGRRGERTRKETGAPASERLRSQAAVRAQNPGPAAADASASTPAALHSIR